MQKLRKEYRQFLNNNFKGLEVKTPLFYNWKFGLRFDLQVGDATTDEYFFEVLSRASTLFQSVFKPDDQLYFVFIDYTYKRKKIRFLNYSFKQIKNLTTSEIEYKKVKQLYDPEDKSDIWSTALIKLTAERINYTSILSAIAHTDFPPRNPRLDKNGIFSNKEIYFVNIDQKLIFHMYDDRGLDIIATDIETLRPIYTKYYDWILDCDREKIDKQFERKN